MRRLDSAARSPVYSLFTDCIEAGAVIRSLRQPAVEFFQNKFLDTVNNFLRINFSLSVASQWLNIRLQTMGVCIATGLAAIAILGTIYGLISTSGAQLGLALAYSLSIVNNLNGLVSSLAETEQAMISVERIYEYVDLPDEFAGDYDDVDTPYPVADKALVSQYGYGIAQGKQNIYEGKQHIYESTGRHRAGVESNIGDDEEAQIRVPATHGLSEPLVTQSISTAIRGKSSRDSSGISSGSGNSTCVCSCVSALRCCHFFHHLRYCCCSYCFSCVNPGTSLWRYQKIESGISHDESNGEASERRRRQPHQPTTRRTVSASDVTDHGVGRNIEWPSQGQIKIKALYMSYSDCFSSDSSSRSAASVSPSATTRAVQSASSSIIDGTSNATLTNPKQSSLLPPTLRGVDLNIAAGSSVLTQY